MNHGYGYFEDEHPGHIGDLRLWRRIMGFVVPYWRRVALAVLLSLLISAATLTLPYLMRLAVDRYIVHTELAWSERLGGLNMLALVFAGVMLVAFGANFFQVTVLEWSGQRIMHALRQRVFEHLVTLRLAFFHAHPVGRLVTRLTNDIQNMHEMFTAVIVTLFNEFIKLVAITAILLWMNWRLALLLSLILPVIVLVSMWFGRLARDAFRRMRSSLAGINAFLQETLAGLVVIQLFLRERDTLKRFSAHNREYFRRTLHQIKVFGFFMPFIDLMNSLAIALIVWYGGGEILRRHMTLGDLVAFISYIRLFFQPLRELSQQYSVVQSAMASAERIFQLLETREVLPVVREPLVPGALHGKIEFHRVSFGYEPDQPVLRELSFTVRPGETLAVVGATGAGKTTIINLLERFYDPEAGEVCLDGVDLRRLDPFWLREQIGLVMQEVLIVAGSVRDNITLDRRVAEQDLQRVLAASQLEHVVSRLPMGLETAIGEGGLDLSAGERQLLAFARVLVRDPRVLVLDEATAHVDSDTEMRIEQAIEALLAERTSIVIAHRLSTIRRADRILVMDQGRLVEEGSHSELMARRGLYFHLQTLDNGWRQASQR
jgi:ATP-binding cassette subfamily B protein